MIYLIPTKRGVGVEIWGTHGDFNILYEVIGTFWNDENHSGSPGFESRNQSISAFSYEIRKAKEGQRLKRETNHLYPYEQVEYFGTQISWVHFLFSMAAIKYNMQFYETTKLDASTILQIEFWLEKAMNSFDEVGARALIPFINDGIHGANEYIYQYMRSINLEFFLLGGGKRAFRQLPQILRKGIFYSEQYNAFKAELEADAERLNCKVADLEIDDDDFDYDGIKW